MEFLKGLGTLLKLADTDPQCIFLGGLERDGLDGKFTYIWQDDIMQVSKTRYLKIFFETDFIIIFCGGGVRGGMEK